MKNKIVPALIILLVVALIGANYLLRKNPAALASFTCTDSTEWVAEQPAASGFTHKADIVVAKPVSPSRKGVIEIGSKGFNMFIVDLDRNGNWEIVEKQFGKSLAYEGFLTADDVKLGLKDYLATMIDKGVAGKNCHFVVSSGALKNPKTELIMNSITKMGYVVNKITPEQEGAYALLALLPKEYVDKGFVVDIGGGNTKVSWYENGQIRSLEGPGAKYQQAGLTDAQVQTKIEDLIKQVPVSLRQYCFIIGGVPMNLAEPNATPRFQALQPASDYMFEKENVYLTSGLNIYTAIQNVASPSTTKYIFDWDSNFSIGFLINNFKA